jgi:hypothetical protein
MALMLDYMHGRTVEDETEYDTLFLPLGLSDFVSLSLSLSGGKAIRAEFEDQCTGFQAVGGC